jgi:hypothetical protein
VSWGPPATPVEVVSSICIGWPAFVSLPFCIVQPASASRALAFSGL